MLSIILSLILYGPYDLCELISEDLLSRRWIGLEEPRSWHKGDLQQLR